MDRPCVLFSSGGDLERSPGTDSASPAGFHVSMYLSFSSELSQPCSILAGSGPRVLEMQTP